MAPAHRISSGLALRPAFHAWFLAAAMALTLVIALPSALAANPRPEVVQFSLVDLGTLGGVESHAYAINKLGLVAGDSLTSTQENHGFLWESGTMRDLGTLGGNQSTVAALNDRGQVVGYSTTATGETHAFLWTDGVILDLGTLPGGYESRARAINNRGQIVGTSSVLTATDPFEQYANHAFLWEDGTMYDLGTLGGWSSTAMAINDAGQVAGYSDTSSSESHAVLWADGRMTDLTVGPDSPPCDCFAVAIDLNERGQVVGLESRGVPAPPPFYTSVVDDAFLWGNGTKTIIAAGDVLSTYQAWKINDRGEVSGTHVAGPRPGVMYAFFWRDGSMQEWNLGGISLKTTAMNKNGQVVGEGMTAVGETHGYSWHEGMVTDLGDPLTRAADVNDHGLVVGSAYFLIGGIHAALWTPIGQAAPPVGPGASTSAR
jgi:probable HAF family extracellular repeat protein